jgi:YVTN family beta-propeller protein
VAVGRTPVAVAVDRHTRHVFVVNQASNTLSVLDSKTGALLRVVPVGHGPTAVLLSRSTGQGWVLNTAGNSISVLSTTGAVRRTVPVGTHPAAAIDDVRTHRVFVANAASGTVSVLDARTEVVLRTVPVGRSPSAVAVNETSNRVFVANSGSGTISVLNATTGAVLRSVAAGKSPTTVAVDVTYGHLFVTNSGSGTISVLNATTGAVLRTIAVGRTPSAVEVDPTRHRVFVANRGSGTVSVLDARTGKPLRSVAVGKSPIAVVMDRVGDRAFVVNRDSNTISVLDASIGRATPTPTATRTPTATPTVTPSSNHAITTVFLLVMENHNWSSIAGSSSAPYINTTLLPTASHAEQYYNPPGLHPSLGNYLWLESGQCFTYCGTDNDPSSFPNGLIGPTLHSQLSAAGISWRGYFEDMTDGTCPMAIPGAVSYTVHHNPFVYYNDVTSNPQCPNLKSYADLSGDLANSTVARYNVIVPDKCDDMHDSCAPYNDPIRQGDTWLQNTVPAILNSPAYKNGGALFITWDEAASGDGPIGMIVLSPYARGGGYANAVPYTHSSTLRTLEEIFGVSPYLGDAANATDLRDLFRTFP